MIDFTNYETKKKSYGGANGSKKSIMIGDDLYMLKLPSKPRINHALSYSNSPITEHIASSIFNLLGINAQETVLGKYTYHDVERVVVACKDFTYPDGDLYDFTSLRNQVVDSETNGHSTELSDILTIFREQDILDPDALESFFWDVFVIDALLGNWDRHNGNWGYLHNRVTDEVKIAPVYDNGSSLYPQADESIMNRILANKAEMNRRIYEIPLSAITIEGEKINYWKYMTSNPCDGLKKAILRMAPKIDLDRIDVLIDSVEGLTPTQKTFYKTMIKKRKECIIDPSYDLIISKD